LFSFISGRGRLRKKLKKSSHLKYTKTVVENFKKIIYARTKQRGMKMALRIGYSETS
jgi:hypothetical protein